LNAKKKIGPFPASSIGLNPALVMGHGSQNMFAEIEWKWVRGRDPLTHDDEIGLTGHKR